MKPKHTPGPWIAPQVNVVCTKADWNSQNIETLNHGFQVSVSLALGEDQARVDAQLISAAPDMIETLKAFVGYLGDGDTPSEQVLVNRAKRDIAKATGGAQ